MRRKRTWLIVLAVLAAFITAVLVALPVAARMLAEARVQALTGREATIGDVDLNLFTRRLVVDGSHLHGQADEPPPLAFGQLTARFRLLSLLRGRVELERMVLTGLDVYLERTRPDRLNVSDIAAHIAARPEGEPLELVVDSLSLEGGRIRLEDRAVEPGRHWVLQDLGLEAHDVSTVAEGASGRASATFVVAGAPGELEVRRLGVRPPQAQATLKVDGLDLSGLGAYFPADAAVSLAGGRLTTRLRIIYGADGALQGSGEAAVHELTFVHRGQEPALLTVPAATVTAHDLVYDAGDVAAGRLELATDQVTVLDATAPRARPLDVTAVHATWQIPPDAPPGAPGRLGLRATLPEGGAVVADGTLDVRPLTADVGVEIRALDVGLGRIWTAPDATIVPAAGRLAGTLDLRYAAADGLVAGGRLRVDDLALARAGQEAPVVRDERVQVTARDLAVRDGRLVLGRVEVSGSPTLIDGSVTPALQLRVPSASVVAEGGAAPGGPPTRLRLDARLPGGGRLQASGAGGLAPASLVLTVRATDADLGLAAPYVPEQTPVRLDRGRLDAEASVTWDGALRVAAHLVARDLTVLRRGQAEPFIHHPSLEGAVTGLVVRDGQLVVERVALEGTPTVVDTTASPPQRFDVQGLALVMKDFTWPGRRPARLQGQIRVADGGRGELTGTLHPATLATDLRARFDNVEVTRAGGYLPPEAPLAIDSGRGEITLSLRHRRADGVRLGAEGAIHDVALRLAMGPGVRVRDQRLTFAVTGLVVHDGETSLEAAVVDGTPALGRAADAAPPLSRLHAEVRALRWPDGAPASWRLVAEPADGGRVQAEGTLAPAARTVTGTLEATDAAITAFAALIPIDAPLAGRLDARLRGRAAAGQPPMLEGELTLHEARIGPPDAAPVRAERLTASGLALHEAGLTVGQLVVQAPSVVVEREQDGDFPLRAMFTPASPAASPRASGPRIEPATGGERPAASFTIDELVVREGNVRFIDHTTTPAYSEEISRLALTVRELTNAGDGRATVTVQGIVGVDAALELQGELAPFDRPFFLDVRGELRSFAVPRTNPYLQRFLDWIARRGELTTRVHYRIEDDELTATNEITVQRLDVEPTGGDEAPDRLVGLPLGLAVALLKDARGEIHVNVPISGQLGSPQFSFGDAIRRAFANVLGRLVTAPFRAIGSVFRRGDGGTVEDVAIEPVTFSPGSAVVTPDAAAHLQRVADFLRARPYVRLTLQPVVSEEDLRALRLQEVAARIQRVQREQDLGDFEEAARRVWRDVRPDAAPPADPQALVRALAEREPEPTEAARRLAERRVGATRTELVDAAGIPDDRLLEVPDPEPPGAGPTGGVEFGLRSAS